jgi:chorismate dehydratase
LVRVLLEQGGRPPAVYRTEEEETLLRFPSDLPGILLIGDRALVARHVHPPAPPWQAHDLADLWWQWTGLPMVFAVWAVRQAWARTHPGEMAWLQEQILAALAGFERQPAPVLAEAARRIPLERAVLTSYYRGLRYRLQESELAGLHRFAAEVERLPALGSPPTGQFQVSGGA